MSLLGSAALVLSSDSSQRRLTQTLLIRYFCLLALLPAYNLSYCVVWFDAAALGRSSGPRIRGDAAGGHGGGRRRS